MSARLPTVGGDSGNWGTLLNQFLQVGHNSDGTLNSVLTGVNVKDYGAKGDGSADDTTAIQNAINALTTAGGVVFFPIGTYVISSSLIVDSNYVQLVSFGQGSTIIQIASASDPTYALIIGNTKYVKGCEINGLTFMGKNSGTSTGSGIKWGSDIGAIKNTRVFKFSGTGIYLNGVVGQIYQTVMEDVYVAGNGVNTTGSDQARSNIYIDSNMANCEYIRCIAAGSYLTGLQGPAKYGFYINNAPDQKFVACHAFYDTDSGLFINFGDGLQVIGGEYENCGVAGLNINHINRGFISGVQCYGQSANAVDIGIYNNNNLIVSGCAFTSNASNLKNVVIYSSYTVIADCYITSSTKAIEIDSGNYNIVHDCNLIHSGGTLIDIYSNNSIIHDNVCTGNIFDHADNNIIHDNNFISGTVGLIGKHSVARNNFGYNPVGKVTAPSIPASGTAVTNTSGVDVMVYLSGGTVTAVAIGGQATGLTTAETYRLPVGQTITLTYSVAPTWTWFGD